MEAIKACRLFSIIIIIIITNYCSALLFAGGGGMRVGPQYQAVVPDFDPGESIIIFKKESSSSGNLILK